MITVIIATAGIHPRMVEEICQDAGDELGVEIALETVDRPEAIGALLDRADDRSPIVVCPGDCPDLDEVLGRVLPGPRRIVRVDAAHRVRDESDGLAAHIRGRGADGLRWAIRTAVHHDRHHFRLVRYGALPDQFGELLLPEHTPGPHALAVLIHGGYWHDRWQLDLMDAMAVDLAARGIAVWNIEYRRPDVYDWPGTVSDVRAALDHVRELGKAAPIDTGRVVVIGHSAGGQLAARVCADAVASPSGIHPVACVSLAGVLDLVAAARRELGERAVPMALGAEPGEAPDEYAASSPLARLPIGVPTIVATAQEDSRDLTEIGWRYSAAARSCGDDVQEIHGPGGHFALIDPAAAVWQQVRTAVLGRLTAPSE